MIEFKKVSKYYGDSTVIDEETFTVQTGEFFVLVGPSGGGKTTTLKMINRLVDPSSGQILLDGVDISTIPLRQLRLEMGYVLQQIALFPNMTVGQNIVLIPEMKGWDKDKRTAKAKELLETVGLDPSTYFDRYPSELSGGEQQRIGILRAIIANPKVLLMDEPFSALDPITRAQLQDVTVDLHNKLNITIIFVTHDINEALYLADRICVVQDGRIAQTGSPDDIENHPANQFVSDLFTHTHRRRKA
ncbi:ABC transporter ATP-binding protein [Scardovia inopinata]|uniref:ABC-type quaternary amine transporter n=1 Tax=Scardovia inopinata F0304 TaxID=641146 RepID=W5IIL5_SCAIO|nr:ABC transporter ATP-binding protein [Scardovia inopinata]EFG26700.1 hypothetical protein HMPREF9020_00327 [Scardovia inopinata F0304]BAR06301.1 putative glycine betaine/L-proline ABC transporter ATP-binding component [Scardovia inopinata JCM 12537]SUV51821.1 ABC transporter ATP-binding protein [Scardovia inopinata]